MLLQRMGQARVDSTNATPGSNLIETWARREGGTSPPFSVIWYEERNESGIGTTVC